MKTIVSVIAACLLIVSVAYAEKVADRPEDTTPAAMTRNDCVVTGYDGYTAGSGGPIPDCDPTGLLVGPIVTADTGTIEDVIFWIDIEHTWIGDLRVWLLYDVDCDVNVDYQGEVLCRHSLDGCPQDDCCGCSGDLVRGWYGFDDTVASIEDECPSVFTPFCYGPDYDSVGLDVFDGLPSGGCFYLYVSDGACADIGTVHDWSVYLLTEDEPTGGALDIKPESCPNPFNVKARGQLPVALVSTEDFDATMIDVTTLSLECPNGSAAPIRSTLSDVATPMDSGAEPCECTEEGPDGLTDLKLSFWRQDILAVLGPVDDGDEVELTLTGEMMDGTPFEVSDCIEIIKRGKLYMAAAPDGATSAVTNPRDGGPTTWGTIKALYR
jgi:subtilisin-like proprotein convertase family protein